jgi:hypothetical protein
MKLLKPEDGIPERTPSDRCGCSFNPTSMNDFCDVHRPDWSLCNLKTGKISFRIMSKYKAIGKAAEVNAYVGKKVVKAVRKKV